MKKIYLIRHGESQWNVIRKIQGQKDISLTDKGVEQAKLIGDRLTKEKIDKIYSSDLERAYNTAKIIGNKIGINPIPKKDFREINFGVWEGLSNDKMMAEYYDEVYLWRKEPEKLKIEGGETLQEVQIRAMKCLEKIVDTSNDESILIVSHGVTLKTIILGLLDMDLMYFKNLTINNVGLTIVEFREYNKVLRVLNDTSHVKENISI